MISGWPFDDILYIITAQAKWNEAPDAVYAAQLSSLTAGALVDDVSLEKAQIVMIITRRNKVASNIISASPSLCVF